MNADTTLIRQFNLDNWLIIQVRLKTYFRLRRKLARTVSSKGNRLQCLLSVVDGLLFDSSFARWRPRGSPRRVFWHRLIPTNAAIQKCQNTLLVILPDQAGLAGPPPHTSTQVLPEYLLTAGHVWPLGKGCKAPRSDAGCGRWKDPWQSLLPGRPRPAPGPVDGGYYSRGRAHGVIVVLVTHRWHSAEPSAARR